MPSDGPAFDVGLLSPVTVGFDDAVSDAAFLDALVTAEVALVRARGALGLGPADVVERVSEAMGWTAAGRAVPRSRDRCAGAGRGIRRRGQPGDPAREAAHRCGGAPRRDAPRRDEPGHPRLGAHVHRRPRRPRDLRVAAADRRVAAHVRGRAPRRGRRGPHPDPARGADDGRTARGELAARRAAGDAAGGCRDRGAARAAGRRRRDPRVVRRTLRGGCRGRPARRVRRRARPRRARGALAHHPLAGHRARRRARAGDRRGRRDRHGCRHARPHRDRRALRRRRRRFVGDAAEAESRGIRADPIRRAARSAARRDPAPRLGARRRRATRRRLARGVADAARAAAARPRRDRQRRPAGRRTAGRRGRRRAQPRRARAGSSRPSGSRSC